jgi:predicted tellurium resistance membrane protein TerC
MAESRNTGQSIILLLGGLFLIYKAPVKLERSRKKGHEERKELGKAQQNHFKMCFMIDLVFSFDSILTAVGMTNGFQGHTS